MIRRVVLTATTALLVLAGAISLPSSTGVPPGDDLGCPDSLVEQTLANGATWRMCLTVDDIKGLVLSNVEFRPATGDREYAGFKRILDELSLAQLTVSYDNGAAFYNDLTSYGLGGERLLSQTPTLCRGTVRDVTWADDAGTHTTPGICLQQTGTGLAYHSQEWYVDGGPLFLDQGTGLEISSLSKVGWYEYQQQVVLDDRGVIDVGLGATGDVAPSNVPGIFFTKQPATGWELGPAVDGNHYYAVSHWHHAIYRVDFGIDSATRQNVEQWDYSAGDGAPTLLGTLTARDRAFSAAPTGDHGGLTWWRVVNPDSLNPDGHPRSYEIVDANPTNPDLAVAAPLVSFTNANPCQQYASFNLDPGCPNQSVLNYVAEDDAPLTDPVGWINVDFHHVDRDEDQSPMHTHWQRFQLVPRDFFAQNPSTPIERSCINGPGLIDSAVQPCIATNTSPPRITGQTPVVPGTMLTAKPGSWIERRTTWAYDYLWFRDGAPILDPTPATGTTYVVTEADVGHTLTVKVTASAPGFISGVAESQAVTVHMQTTPPTPTPTVTTAPTSAASLAPAAPATATIVAPRRRVTRVGKRIRIKVRVLADGAAPTTGWVRVRRGHVAAKLVNGVATLRLKRYVKAGRHRVVIRYRGSASVGPATTTVIVRVRQHR